MKYNEEKESKEKEWINHFESINPIINSYPSDKMSTLPFVNILWKEKKKKSVIN